MSTLPAVSTVVAAPALPGDLLDTLLAGAGAPDSGWERDWIATHGLPHPKAEAWRYTPLTAMVGVLGASRPADAPAAGALPREALDAISMRYGAVRVVFVDGRYSPGLSDAPEDPEAVPPLPPGTRAGVVGGSGIAELLGRWASPLPDDLAADAGFRVLNAASDHDPAVVMVNPGVAVGSPIHVVHLRTAGAGEVGSLSQPLTLIDVGAGASCRVIESHVSLGAGFTNALTRIRIGVDAHLHHVRVQNEHLQGVHMGDTVIEAHRGAHLESTSLELGAAMARNGLDVALCGEHATAALSGLALLNDRRHCDTVLKVDHRVPNCTSSQEFRAIVDDRSRSSFCGHVLVDHGAAGTDSSQYNHNLLLSGTAKADTRPWLEILADDVKCVHGATVGRLDEKAMFYMLSRGIPREKAESMLVGAFAAQVVDDIEPPLLRDALYARIDALDAGAHEASPETAHETSPEVAP